MCKNKVYLSGAKMWSPCDKCSECIEYRKRINRIAKKQYLEFEEMKEKYRTSSADLPF